MKLTGIKLNLQPAIEPQPRRLPYLLGHGLLYAGLLLLALITVWFGVKVMVIAGAYRRATASSASLTAAGSESNRAQLQAETDTLAGALDTLQTELLPLLPPPAVTRWLPYGDDLAALPVLLPAAADLARAGQAAAALANATTLPDLVSQLALVQPQLARLDADLLRHRPALAAIEADKLSPLLAPRARQLQQLLPQTRTGLQLAQLLPPALGFEQPQTYLLLTQNADELRPSGGYINTAGHIVIDHGQIISLQMQDSYAVDRLSEAYPYPPAPLRNYMKADYWVLRDASWSPDFPEAARTALELYQLGQGVNADGVIAIDQYALPLLLPATGPLTVNGEQVTAANVIDLMQQHWTPEAGQAQDGEWWAQRKSFMLALAEALVQKFETAPESIPPAALAAALQQAHAEKHLLLYIKEERLANLLAERGLDGGLPATGGDYLLVTDANVGFNKASAKVERYLNYTVQLAGDGSGQARAQLLYQHTAPARAGECAIDLRYDRSYAQNMERCAWIYTSLIVPAGAELRTGPGVVVAGRYLLRGQPTSGQVDRQTLPHHKQSWSQLFLLAPAQRLALDFDYRLPPGTVSAGGEQQSYSLLLPKQPGTLEPAVQVSLTLPAGAQLLASDPAPLEQSGSTLLFQFRLTTDRRIRVTYKLTE